MLGPKGDTEGAAGVEQNRGVSDPEYVFVQTVVVHSARQTHWPERTLGRGRIQEVRGLNPMAAQRQRIMQEVGRPSAREPGRGPASVDFWINTIAVGTLAAFLLSLYLLR